MKYTLALLLGIFGCDRSSDEKVTVSSSISEHIDLLLHARSHAHRVVSAESYLPPLQERLTQGMYTSDMWLRDTLDYSAERLWGCIPWD